MRQPLTVPLSQRRLSVCWAEPAVGPEFQMKPIQNQSAKKTGGGFLLRFCRKCRKRWTGILGKPDPAHRQLSVLNHWWIPQDKCESGSRYAGKTNLRLQAWFPWTVHTGSGQQSGGNQWYRFFVCGFLFPCAIRRSGSD